jgi:GNAT superfamily N-acetyltransferase
MELKYKLVEKDSNERIKIWNEIINPQFFYEDEIYYQWYNDMIPYKKGDYWKWLSDEDKKIHLLTRYGYIDETIDYSIYNGDELIGWYSYIIIPEQKNSILKYIAIKETEQRKGYGKIIMNHYLNLLKSEDVKQTQLSFNYHMKGLPSFYRKMGFKGIKEPMGSHLTIYKNIRKSKKK